MKTRTSSCVRTGFPLAIAATFLLSACATLAGDLTVDDLTVYQNARFYGSVDLVSSVAPTNGLRIYYSFNADNGTNITDDSGNSHTGYAYGATWNAGGISQGGYNFDGTDDSIDAGVAASELNIAGSHERTVSVFVRFSVMPTNTSFFFALGDDNYGEKFSMKAYGTQFDVDCRSIGLSSTADAFTTDVWYMVTAVYTGSTMRLYINSAENTNKTLSIDTTDTCDLRLGYEFSGGYGNFRLDEFRIYDRALSPEEVAMLYYCCNPDPDSGRIQASSVAVSNGIAQLASGATNVFMSPVGIGTNVPAANVMLHVNGKVRVEDNIVLNGHWLSGDGGNEGIYVSTDGKVGAGTNAPQEALHVSGASRFDAGIIYLSPLGDLGMGSFTNNP